MVRAPIPIDRLVLRVFQAFDVRWMLLAAGDFRRKDFNVMTVSWGSLGIVWSKPFAQVFVRKSRYTCQFMEKSDSFTLSLFPQEHRAGLSDCGSRTGRRGDKLAAAGFTAVASAHVDAPSFEQAELVIECRKIYSSELFPDRFLDSSIHANYPEPADLHRVYFGEVLSVSGTQAYHASD